MGVFGYDASTIQASADAGTVRSSIKAFGDSGAPLKVYLGGIETDETTGDITSASVIRMVWGLNPFNTTDTLRPDLEGEIGRGAKAGTKRQQKHYTVFLHN